MATALLAPSTSAAPTAPPWPFELRRVLDIENRRVVPANVLPSNASAVCDVLVVGGGLGGVAAAEAAARHGYSVILTEPTRMLGGQLTSQLVPVPDENAHIEKKNGPSTRTYRALRQAVRDHYKALPDVKKDAWDNIGQCWVSRVSGTPDVWETAIRARLQPFIAGGQLRSVLMRTQVRSITRFEGNGRANYADAVDLDTGKVTRIAARFILDATEDGAALALAGLPTRIGQEAQAEFGERSAPETAHPEWVQSFTYCFTMRWAKAGEPLAVTPAPAEYEYFKSFGDYTLDYIYRDKGDPYVVTYKVLDKVAANNRTYLPFWSYRRLIASSSFTGKKSPEDDLALINWRGNDFHEESYLDKALDEQARILERGLNFAKGFAHWLQTECPRDDGSGFGYPELVVGDDSFGIHPYIRESRRLTARQMLTQNDLVSSDSATKWGTEFPDSIGCALYAVDIHPSKNEVPLLSVALPYHIPLGSLLTASGAVNVLPAAKNFGASRLALASARMHPTEFLIGEVAGTLAAFCIAKDLPDPSAVRNDPALLAAFQGWLKEQGVTLSWREILGG